MLKTQSEQLTLWAMAKSPLMFGGDMINLDNMTLSLITNPDILEINANSFGNIEVCHAYFCAYYQGSSKVTHQLYL
jgi:hypothetical protein